MISVRSLLQPLSGSKWLLVVFIGFLLFSSCTTLTKRAIAVGYDQAAEKPLKHNSETDTVRWPDPLAENTDSIIYDVDPVSEDNPEEIIDMPDELIISSGTEWKDSYRIGILLPLSFGDHIADINQLESHYSYRFINFYGGLMLGLDELSKKDIALDVHIINSTISNNDFKDIQKEIDKFDFDVIIGPFDRELLKEVVQYGKEKNILVISPWQSSTKLTENNPDYLQLKPDVKRYYEAIVHHVDIHFQPDQVFMVGRLSEKQEVARLNYLQELHKANSNAAYNQQPYEMVYVNQASFIDGANAFGSVFQRTVGKDVAVIIPNWSFRDEQFVYSCLRKLNAEKGLNKVIVYGMPLLVNSELVDYNLLKNLNIHVAVDKFVNTEDPDVGAFRAKYFKEYNALPAEEAIEGYDLIHFVGENLKEHGTKFQYFILGREYNYLQITYEIVPIAGEESIFYERLEQADYFENKHIQIRKFNNNKFEQAP